MLNKFTPESPDPFLKKGEDMAPAKFGHLNEIVREINAGGGGGGVSSVTATAPCVSSGGADPAISIPKADGTTDGYCSAADFATFNDKQDQILFTATVTYTGAEIIAGSKTILPAPLATKYYVLHSVVAKFKGGTVAFDDPSAYGLTFGSGRGVAANTGTLSEGLTVFNLPTNTTDAMVAFLSGAMGPGESLSCGPYVGSQPTVGDSDLVFDVTYELKDF
jgi:hypothetical protein